MKTDCKALEPPPLNPEKSFREGINFSTLTFDAAYGFVPASAGMRPRIFRDADNSIDDDASHELIDSESARRAGIGRGRGRGQGVNHFAALSRALGGCPTTLSHVQRAHNPIHRGLPRSPWKKKAAGRREREREKKTGCRCVLRFRQRRQRNDKRFRPLPNDLSVFVSRLIYEWGPRETELARRRSLSRCLVPISLYLPSQPVVHGGIRATLFSQLAAFSLPFGIETPVKNLLHPPFFF